MIIIKRSEPLEDILNIIVSNPLSTEISFRSLLLCFGALSTPISFFCLPNTLPPAISSISQVWDIEHIQIKRKYVPHTIGSISMRLVWLFCAVWQSVGAVSEPLPLDSKLLGRYHKPISRRLLFLTFVLLQVVYVDVAKGQNVMKLAFLMMSGGFSKFQQDSHLPDVTMDQWWSWHLRVARTMPLFYGKTILEGFFDLKQWSILHDFHSADVGFFEVKDFLVMATSSWGLKLRPANQ